MGKEQYPDASKVHQAKQKKAHADKLSSTEEESNPMAATADELNDDSDDIKNRLNDIESTAVQEHSAEKNEKPKTVAELHSLLTGIDPSRPEIPKKKAKPMKG